jgi:uncharacterized membrane protein (DUF4010 family)
MSPALSPEAQAVLLIAAAAVGGLAVGVERQWSGHATGPQARFGGIRTFTLLGGFAGVAGWLWTEGYAALATTLVAAAVGLVVVAYASASRRAVDATTEVAALVVVAAGVLAGLQHVRLASGIIAVTVLILVEKSYLHSLVARIDDAEMRAASRFAIMAVVILPLLPSGPYGPLGGVRPRELWALVLLFSGISFAGYIARRAVGAERGYPVTGSLGGLISSTSVTLNFARASRSEPQMGAALAGGVVAASTVLFVRAFVAAVVLSPPFALAVARLLAVPFAVGVAATAIGLRFERGAASEAPPPSNPLQLWNAIQMVLLFQVVLFAVHVVRQEAGDAGLLVSGAVLGFADVDAVVLSMAKSVSAGAQAGVAAQSLAIGIVSNTVLKMVLALALGRSRFRLLAFTGLAVIALATAGSVLLQR